MTGLRALIVDDNAMMRTLVEKAVSAAGVTEIDYAGNGIEALRSYRSQPYDLIVLDNIMPRMTGIEFLTELRNESNLQKTHVIMVTGIVDQNLITQIRMNRMKVDDLIVKPFDVKKLQAKIAEFISRRKRNGDSTFQTANRSSPAPVDNESTLVYHIINRGALAILEFKGSLTNKNKALINTALKELQHLYAKLIVLDVNDVREIDHFGYGTILIVNGYMDTFGKQAYLSFDDCPMRHRILALGITKVIAARDRAADSLDI